MRRCLQLILILAFRVASAQPAQARAQSPQPTRPPARAMIIVRVHSSTQPIATASVFLFSLPDSVIRRTASTDTTGVAAFVDVQTGRYRLRTEIVGYESDTRDIHISNANSVRIDVDLHESAVTLPGLLAEGDRQRARFEQSAGATVTELTQRDLKMVPALGEADVLRAIDVLPGVVSTSDFSSAFNVRGGSADENLILLDGLPIYNPFHLGGLFSVFNADMVKRAELLSGGFPAQYGGRVSSVLNVESDAGDSTSAVQSGVSILATRVAMGTNVPHKLLNLAGLQNGRARVSFRRSYFDALLKPVFDFPYHLTDAQLFFDATSAGGARVTVSGYTGHDVLDLAGVDSFPLQLKWHWGNDVIGGSWTLPLAHGMRLESRLGFTRFQTAITFPQFGDTDFSSKITQSMLRTELSGSLHRSQWRVGVSADHLAYHNLAETGGTVFGENNDRGSMIGLFAQQSYRTGGWLIETGLRGDVWKPKSAGTMGVAQPRVAVKRFLGVNENYALKLAAGRYAQFAHSIRDEEIPLGIDVWVLSGDRAPVVTSSQVQGGLEAFLPNKWYAAVESYYREFNGVTANNYAENPDNPTDDLLRGHGRSYGADLQVRKDNGRVRPMLAVSWLKATRSFADIGVDPNSPPTLTYAPIFDRRLDVDLVIQATLPRAWELGIRWNLGTGLPYTRPIGAYTVYEYSALNGGYRTSVDVADTSHAVVLGPRNGERYPVYHRLDVGVHREYRKHWGTITPSIDVLNMYNRRNVLFYFFNYDESPATRSGVSMFPLLPTIGVEIKF